MLYNIITSENFDDCLKGVENAFYSLEPLMSFDPATDAGKKIMEEKVLFVEQQNLYKIISATGKAELPMPYLDNYHQLFLKEKNRKAKGMRFTIDSSKNEGNYYHFNNVVAALARLIIFFKEPENINLAFASNNDGRLKLHEDDRALLQFEKQPTMRTFRLMLAGFYHDLGKTVTDPRHPMEGAIILAYHSTQKRLKLDKIAKQYDPKFEIERDDLLFIADLVLYHDQYGTLSTGEDGYMALVYVIDKIKRYSLKPDPKQADASLLCRYNRCKKNLFDLWLLNVADIMVSLNNKFKKQDEWRDAKRANEKITNFFKSEKGSRLRHDLEITFSLLCVHTDGGKSEHCDDLTVLERESHLWSKRHSIERLRRLVTELLGAEIKKIRKSLTGFKNIEIIVGELESLEDVHWNLLITRCIRSVADFDDFTSRLSWIGKMDYALGFFQKILSYALDQVIFEILAQEASEELAKQFLKDLGRTVPKQSVSRSGWIREPSFDSLRTDDPQAYCKTQAVFFASNFVATVIQILEHLLFREKAIDRLRNIEFNDTKDRITEDKLKQLLSLEGPFRARRSIEAILQTIYLY